MADPIKDRTITLPIAPGQAEILYLRSSAHPLTYSLVLRVRRGEDWVAVLSADNSHEGRPGVDTHHLHRYHQGVKQPAESLPFPVANANDAMVKVSAWMAEEWEDLSR